MTHWIGSYSDHDGHLWLLSHFTVCRGHACCLKQSPEARYGLAAERVEPVLRLLLKFVKTPVALSAEDPSSTVGSAGSCSLHDRDACAAAWTCWRGAGLPLSHPVGRGPALEAVIQC